MITLSVVFLVWARIQRLWNQVEASRPQPIAVIEPKAAGLKQFHATPKTERKRNS